MVICLKRIRPPLPYGIPFDFGLYINPCFRLIDVVVEFSVVLGDIAWCVRNQCLR